VRTWDLFFSLKRNYTDTVALIYKINTDMEDTTNALKQAEALVDRLRRRLDELQGMYRILTKK
jgi:predicted translin family RNA/ssDNA-binding protein